MTGEQMAALDIVPGAVDYFENAFGKEEARDLVQEWQRVKERLEATG